ncbi:MAG: hypothetical protein QOG26_1146, partial [Solirubrobacterales bacterium]|nr:hypothetical protein [Solirubrobacterales bacterium]
RQLQARALAFLEPRCRALGWNPQGNVARQQMIRHRELAPVVAARRLALSYAAVN